MRFLVFALLTSCLTPTEGLDCNVANPELNEGEQCKEAHGYCCFFYIVDGHATNVDCESPWDVSHRCECPTPTINICEEN